MTVRNLLYAAAGVLIASAVVGLLLLIGKLPAEQRHYSAFATVLPVFIPVWILAWRRRHSAIGRNIDNV